MKRIQTNTSTKLLRHREATVEIIRHLSQLGDAARLLCFGSSWGAEVMPFAAALPKAQIIAAEINPVALSQCRKIFDRCANVTVIDSDWDAIAAHGPYHAITANSVLCRHPASVAEYNIAALFSFAEFEDTFGRLDALLAQDGRLAVHNANYRLGDSTIGQSYLPHYLRAVEKMRENFVCIFNVASDKLVHTIVSNGNVQMHVNRSLDTESPDTRKTIAKLVNQTLFIKSPSRDSADRAAAAEAIFDKTPSEFDMTISFDVNLLTGVTPLDDDRFERVNMRGAMQADPDRSTPDRARFLMTTWWGDQIMDLPTFSD